MLVMQTSSASDLSISQPLISCLQARSVLSRLSAAALLRLQKNTSSEYQSLSAFSIISSAYLNSLDVDILNLRWIQGETLSIPAIGRIRKPFVWTLHDMWPLCGTEHYATDQRWRYGYSRFSRPAYDLGLDLASWNWHRKIKHWNSKLFLVAPSNWLADCIKESLLFRQSHLRVIPNPLDMNFWHPLPPAYARQALDLPYDRKILLFGALGDLKQTRKGFDLLKEAISRLVDLHPPTNLCLLVLGEKPRTDIPRFDLPVHYLGRVKDDEILRLSYSAADLLVLPSRQDNLPNMAVEAQACGLPVVAFDIGGIPDIVDHLTTGYLARPYCTQDLAQGMIWALSRTSRSQDSAICRNRAIINFCQDRVASQYLRLYEEVRESLP